MEEYLNWTTEDLLERYQLLQDSVDEMVYEDYEKAMRSKDAVELNLVKDILFERRMKEKPLEKMSLLELAQEYANAYYTSAEGWGFSEYFAERVQPLIEEELKRRDKK